MRKFKIGEYARIHLSKSFLSGRAEYDRRFYESIDGKVARITDYWENFYDVSLHSCDKKLIRASLPSRDLQELKYVQETEKEKLTKK